MLPVWMLYVFETIASGPFNKVFFDLAVRFQKGIRYSRYSTGSLRGEALHNSQVAGSVGSGGTQSAQ
jgi:hypothetical protein